MQKENAKKAAQFVLEDRRGADFYSDEKLLSKYLEGALGYLRERPHQRPHERNKAIKKDLANA